MLAGGTEGGSSTAGLAGEAALLSAIQAPRTGRMSDIVATIQAEQDRIIRADRNGILVVQGGPGTGKTAVALHRAAYLLYTHREQLGQRGVLIIGPNPTFLRLHRPGAALARRERRRAVHHRRPVPRCVGARRGGRQDRAHQGPHAR